MTVQESQSELADLTEINDELNLNSNLKDYEEYDSMALMSLVAFIHKNFSKTI